MKTTWNLKLLYSSVKDPAIGKDVEKMKAACRSFEKKWKKDASYLSDGKTLRKALADYEKLYALFASSKPTSYLSLLSDVDTTNKTVKAELTKFEQVVTAEYNRVLFFELGLGTLPVADQKKLLASKDLAEYHYFLRKIFEHAKYQLSESEEKIINMLTLPSKDLWIDGVRKSLSEKQISWKGKTVGLGQAAGMIRTLPRNDCIKLHGLMLQEVKKVSSFAESEINAIVTAKKIVDGLRSYPHPYSETVQRYENDEKTVEKLIEAVTSHFSISHKFYAIRKKMMGITGPMTYVDISAEAGKIKKSFDFEGATDIVRRSFHKADPEFSAIFDSYLKNGQIDVLPRVGKRSGAYCASFIGLPTFVLLNHVSSFDSVKTLAHEMGHAVHGEYSKRNRPLYEYHTIATAEVASTLFENFAFDDILESLPDDEQVIALHNRIMDNVATVFRQIAFINFEIELHALIRKDGFASADAISNLMVKHLKSYVGPAFKFDMDDGLFWIRLSHIRSFFYMYTYAYGQLISNAMYAKYKADPSFMVKIKKFLSAGGSDTPENIFKSIGIDTSKDEFWAEGLKLIAEDVAKLERLVNKKAKK